MARIRLPHNFEPRDYQLPLLQEMDSGKTRAVWVAHRRSGKDLTAINYMAKKMYERVGAYYYLFPSYSQGKKVIWNGMNRDGFKFTDYIPKELRTRTNNQEMIIEMDNGSLFQVIGTDNMDSVVGTNPVGCVFSEYSLQDPAAWDYIRPILAENGGWAIFVYTPRGKNHGYDLLQTALAFPDQWYAEVLTVEDTQAISQEILAQERAEIIRKDGNDAFYQQEYMCFPQGTNISTSQGLKDISEVQVNDRVLTHTGRYRNVKERFVQQYAGELITIRTYGDSKVLRVTPEHPLRVLNPVTQTYDWRSAGQVEKNDFLVLPKRRKGRPLASLSSAKLIAWYIAEGSCGRNFVSFALGGDEEGYADEIIECLEDYGCKHQKRVTETGLVVIGNSCYLADFLANSCGSGAVNKRIPFDLISGHEQSVYDTLMKGDGCVAKTDVEEWDSYTTISESLAYDVQLLASSLSYRAGIGRRKSNPMIMGRKCKVHDSFSVQIRKHEPKRKSFLKIRPAKNGVGVKVKEVKKEDFCGSVYNLGVQFDESYVADGRVVHNCSFEVPIQGAYYAHQMMQAQDEGRICSVPYDENALVHTYWDLGVNDLTTIWFVQTVGREIHLIDYYENSGEGINHYIKYLGTKPYIYGEHWAPHDIKVRVLTEDAKSRKEIARGLGVDFQVVPNLSKEDGREAVRNIASRCWFDKEKCDRGIQALRSYHKKWDELNQCWGREVKDWSVHGSDAFRMLAVGYREERKSLGAVENNISFDPY